MSLIGLLVVLLVACVVLWAARALLAAFGIGNPIATVVYMILVLIILFWLLQQLGVTGTPILRIR